MSQSNNHFVINRLKDKAVLQFECWLKDAYIPVKEDLREPIDEAVKKFQKYIRDVIGRGNRRVSTQHYGCQKSVRKLTNLQNIPLY